jgi:MFS family permease
VTGSDSPGPANRPLPRWLAVALVMGTSASVLVLEILAGRLLAPYVGVSLETYTGIIGTVLVGIAAGAAAGGALADRMDPRRLLPLLLLGGGAAALATVPVVRALGGAAGAGGGSGRILLLTACGVLPPATVLSAVPPAVVKLQLRDLAATGSTVGRLSALGTAGAIAGTFLTGFALVAWAAVTTLIVAVGLVLVAAGVGLWWWSPRRSVAGPASLGVVAVLCLGAVALVDAPCEVQTAYYCASVVADPWRPDGRTLVLDDLRHSYADLDDPTHLEFWYVRRIVDAIDVAVPAGPLDAAHIGGGAMTIPRYVQAVRPGSDQVVFEIDRDLVDLVGERLGARPGPGLTVVVGDGRLGLHGRADDSADVVVGDAFGSRAVPWHLATEEFTRDIARVLRPGGVYAANLIDGGGRLFLRAEVATVARVFAHVLLVLGPEAAAGRRGNSVIVASDAPLDAGRYREVMLVAGDSGTVLAGDELDEFVAGAAALTDEFAPVDQLIARSG